MTVTDRKRRIHAQKIVNDLQIGDMVRRVGFRGVGIIESITDGHAVVAWTRYRHDILPIVSLRRVHAGGHEFDRKAKP